MTVDYVVAIPSYRRAETLATKTLPMLRDGGVDLRRVTVFVVDDERDEYLSALSAFRGIAFAPSSPTVRAARNAVATWYSPDVPVVSVDDDIAGLDQMVDSKTLVPVDDVDALIREAWSIADAAGARLWGLYPVRNPYFMRHRVTTDLRYIGGALFGVRHTGLPEVDLVECDDKDDYERSCRYYLHDGTVVRIGYVAWRTSWRAGGGGMQTYRSLETIREGAERMLALFPDLCSSTYTRKSGTVEVRLRDRRPTVAR